MYLGLDFGTGGARACVVDESGIVVHENRFSYRDCLRQTPEDWREALHTLLRQLPAPVSSQLKRIAIDATSASVLLCDVELQPASPALLYNDSRALAQAQQLLELSPAGHAVNSASSSLAKFLWLTQNINLENTAYFMHQADWLSALLTGSGGTTDYHNALKSGYNVEHLCWPEWVMRLPHSHLLPHVLAPGSMIAEISQALAQHFNINPACTIHAGTTDSIAAFIAADVHCPGDAVTSLGTTMVLKLLSTTRVEAAEYGVYSHRYGDLWLAGGASNAGGGALQQFFSDAQLVEISKRIDGSGDSPLDYYPLPRKGERFPHNDPEFMPRLSPRPDDDAQFLHGLLQGLSRIEADGYALLAKLGATPLNSVTTVGGGAGNASWTQIRQRLLGVPVSAARRAEAAYGAAKLARHAAIICS
jgi:sugar (pentulose or hexulose) kinase